MTNTAIKQKAHRDSVEVRFAKLETALPFLATKADLADVKTELKQDIANVRTELKDAINNQTKWFSGLLITMLVTTVGILLKLLSH